jgi:hypothetical protein
VRSPSQELALLLIRGSKLCLTIVGTLKWGSLHEGMWFAAAYHTEMAMQLAVLWTTVSSGSQSVLGRSPSKALQAHVVGGDSCQIPRAGGAVLAPLEPWLWSAA